MAINADMPYDFLAALARFPRLKKIRIYACFDLMYTSRKTGGLPNIRTDIITIRYMFAHMRRRIVGLSLQQVEVMLGNYGGRQVTVEERLNIMFKCWENKNGKIVTEQDPCDQQDGWWNFYYNVLSEVPRQTFPGNLLEIVAADEEARRVVEQADLNILAGLFGDSPELGE